MENTKIIEITKENWEEYKSKLLNLETKVKNDMVKQGIGDLFFTTGEDIKDYVDDERHHVYAMTDDNNNVIAQTYIIGPGSHIQGTYADLPKYFTMGENFLQYLRTTKYKNEEEFKKIVSTVYKAKISAFKYALRKIYGNNKENLQKFNEELTKERESETHFDEKTELRKQLNIYMTEYMKEKLNMEELYRQFYRVDSNYFKELPKDEYSEAYDKFLEASKITVYSQNIANETDYFDADVYNTIEVDTYITDPDARRKGTAKILSTLALNKTLEEFFTKNKSDVVYLSITLHKDNYLSENVANFLGFKDYIDLERRATIERKAYLMKIERKNYKQYLEYLNKKISYFYGYGDIKVTDEEKERFELEKMLHNQEIVEEIDRRISTENFNKDTLKFISGARDSILGINHKKENMEKPKKHTLTQQ